MEKSLTLTQLFLISQSTSEIIIHSVHRDSSIPVLILPRFSVRASKAITYHKYTGESQIIAPNGRIVHQSLPEGDELYITEIDPKDALDKNITELNDVFEDRRTDIYKV